MHLKNKPTGPHEVDFVIGNIATVVVPYALSLHSQWIPGIVSRVGSVGIGSSTSRTQSPSFLRINLTPAAAQVT